MITSTRPRGIAYYCGFDAIEAHSHTRDAPGADMRPISIILATALAVVADAATYRINSADVGRRLDGYGALSGGGATSRLLFQYPEPQQAEIMVRVYPPALRPAVPLAVGGSML